ncbi:Complement factor H H factor 1 [Collichthys lucidus]|uniref:Complement factor H H factor 1 n=1 Tax=Collichthys lucidus TaxID=240159 RepID=A0A4U5UK29_COLLU|nr:Complement factor H H factor 1 [Collichthys lucidus]
MKFKQAVLLLEQPAGSSGCVASSTHSGTFIPIVCLSRDGQLRLRDEQYTQRYIHTNRCHVSSSTDSGTFTPIVYLSRDRQLRLCGEQYTQRYIHTNRCHVTATQAAWQAVHTAVLNIDVPGALTGQSKELQEAQLRRRDRWDSSRSAMSFTRTSLLDISCSGILVDRFCPLVEKYRTFYCLSGEITCEVPVIENGFVHDKKQQYNEKDVLHFTCNPSFQPAEARPSTCAKSGHVAAWSPTPSYQMVSRTSSRQCMAGGWDGVVPVCEAQQCPAIHVDGNVLVTGDPDEATFGNVIRFSCKSDTEMLEGSVEIYCDENGAWSAEAPKCKEITCEIPVIENGFVHDKKQKYIEKDVLHFTCNPSFQPAEARPSTCAKSGHVAAWSPTPSCERTTCTKPSISNGFVVGPINQMVYFACNEGYKLFTKGWWGAAKCNGTEWSVLDRCIAKSECGKTPVIANGEVAEETGQIKCNNGYQQEVGKLTCQNGKWTSGGIPLNAICRCESSTFLLSDLWRIVQVSLSQNVKPCQLPDDTPNGYFQIIHGEDFVFGTTIRYFCNEGYQMVSKEDTRTCLVDKWTNHVPICDPLTCDPPPADEWLTVSGVPENGEAILPDRFLTFSCNRPGKYLNGSSMVICGRDGNWDTPFPSCEENCKVRDVPSNVYTIPNVRQLRKGEKLKFGCSNRRHFLRGSAEVECLQDGQWSDSFPTCGACSPLPDVPHAFVSEETKKDEYQEGDVIDFTCEPGYTSSQPSKYVCTRDGWLAVRQGKCYSCSPLPDVPHALVSDETKKDEYQEGDVIDFTCEPGYTSSQPSKYVCTRDGWLAVRQGKCYVLTTSCDPPPVGSFTVKGLPGNDEPIGPDHIITFSCDDPGKLNGSSVLICGEDGQWNTPFPSCIGKNYHDIVKKYLYEKLFYFYRRELNCKVGDVPSNVYTIPSLQLGHQLRKGEKLRFGCSNRRHFLRGNAEVQCLPDGQWSDSFPTCGESDHSHICLPPNAVSLRCHTRISTPLNLLGKRFNGPVIVRVRRKLCWTDETDAN